MKRSVVALCAAFVVMLAGVGFAAPRAGATATTYYVSASGSDSNDGHSPTTAWRSVSKVSSVHLLPGDQVLFQGGATFRGLLWISSDDAGDASSRLVVGSYGTGRATIDAGSGTGVFIDNTAGVTIQNLVVSGVGTTSNTGSGVYARNGRTDSSLLAGLTLANIDVHGFGKWGVLVSGEYARSGFRDVVMAGVSAYDNAVGGIIAWSAAHAVHQNVVVTASRAYANPGVSGSSTNTGNGIVFGSVDGGRIEDSTAHGNGGRNDSNEGGCGIWAYESNAVTIQRNESYDNRTGGIRDGGGFDLDQNVSNSTMQYNYSHGNDGPGLMLAQRYNNTNHHDNVVRYNVSENDGRKNGQSGLGVWGGVRSALLYDNTVYVTSSAGQKTPRAAAIGTPGQFGPSNVAFRDNILMTKAAKMLDVPSKVTSYMTNVVFQGNDYWGGRKVSISWAGTIYTTVSSWQSASGQEKLNGTSTALNVNPQLVAPGAGGTIDGTGQPLTSLTAYRLQSTSPLIDEGLDQPAIFGTSVGTRDFFGGTVPKGAGYDVGAHEAK